MFLNKIVKNLFRGALRLCHKYHSSLSKREVTGHFKALNRQTEEYGKPREEKSIVITLNKVCKGRLRGRLRKELPLWGYRSSLA